MWANGSTIDSDRDLEHQRHGLGHQSERDLRHRCAGQLTHWRGRLNVLDGSAGNAIVTAAAGSGPQTLIGAPGDTLNGNGTSDTFIFPTNLGNETINNFNPAHDVIELPVAEIASFAALQADMHNVGTNAVITFDAHDAITISHVAVQNLTAQNFHFMV